MTIFDVSPRQLIVEINGEFAFIYTKENPVGLAAGPGSWCWRPEVVN